MPEPIAVSMPPDLDLPDGYRVVFAAVDPATGNAVPNVTVTAVSIFGTILGTAASGGLTLGPFMLVPGPGA